MGDTFIEPSKLIGDRVRPIIATTLGSIRGNDRVIDSSTTATSTLHHHKVHMCRTYRVHAYIVKTAFSESFIAFNLNDLKLKIKFLLGVKLL